MASIAMQVHTSLEVRRRPGRARRHSIARRGRARAADHGPRVRRRSRRRWPTSAPTSTRSAGSPTTRSPAWSCWSPRRPDGQPRLPAAARCAPGWSRWPARPGVDVAVERAGLARRSKRLIVFDVDSTLCRARSSRCSPPAPGAEAEVRAVTEAAMRGELDFAESLRRRVAAAGGAARVGARRGRRASWSSPRARAPRSARSSGSASAAAWCPAGSPGSSPALADELGLDFCAANELEIVDGRLTGRVRRRDRRPAGQGGGAAPVRRAVRRAAGAVRGGRRRRQRHRHALHRRARHRVQRQAGAARGRRHRADRTRTSTSCCSSWASPGTRSSAPTRPRACCAGCRSP